MSECASQVINEGDSHIWDNLSDCNMGLNVSHTPRVILKRAARLRDSNPPIERKETHHAGGSRFGPCHGSGGRFLRQQSQRNGRDDDD